MGHITINVTGKLGRDPEMKYLPSGKPVTSFSIPVDVGWGEKKTTSWYNFSIFGDRGEWFATNMKKGAMVTVVADNLNVRTYKGRDGTDKMSLEATVLSFQVDVWPPKDGNGEQPAAQPAKSSAPEPEDIPF